MKTKIENIINKVKSKYNEIAKEYVEDAKEYLQKFKDKIVLDLKDPKKRKRYIIGASLAALLILIGNLFTSLAYYNDSIIIPLVQAKVGNLYEKDYDYVLLVYLADAKGDSPTYHLSNNIPSLGYTYSGYKCEHGSTLEYNDEIKMTSVTIKGKEVCSIYFDMTSELDLTTNIMLEDDFESENYIISDTIPIFGYYYSHYDCNGDSTIEYDSNLHKIKMSSGSKDVCNVYFRKHMTDIEVRLFVEQELNSNDYIERVEIPEGINYRLNDKSFCKGLNQERLDNSISYVDGYFEVNSSEVTKCEVYLDRNE